MEFFFRSIWILRLCRILWSYYYLLMTKVFVIKYIIIWNVAKIFCHVCLIGIESVDDSSEVLRYFFLTPVSLIIYVRLIWMIFKMVCEFDAAILAIAWFAFSAIYFRRCIGAFREIISTLWRLLYLFNIRFVIINVLYLVNSRFISGLFIVLFLSNC